MMEQLEFENYIEKIKRRNEEGDYKTATKIANKIPWDEVNDVNILMFVSKVYEKAEDYKDAKMILDYAYEIAPVKNRLYFALCHINIMCRNLKDATDYYIDFCDSFPEDNRKNLLKFEILRAKEAPFEQQRRLLIEYTNEEKDEEMLYEVALLSDKLGLRDEVLVYCDYVVNFFGVKKNGFGKNALLLKKKYVPLTEKEENLLKDAEIGYLKEEEMDVVYKNPPNLYNETRRKEEKIHIPVEVVKIKENDRKEISDELDETKVTNNISVTYAPDAESYKEIEKGNMAFLKNKVVDDKEKLKELINKLKSEEELKNSEFHKYREKSFVLKRRFDDMKIEDLKLHMIVEAYSKEEGASIAQKELNYIHEMLGEKVSIAKASAYNMNEKGFKYYLSKLDNKDLIIENAGKLKNEILDELEEYIINKKGTTLFVLVDVINNFDKIAVDRPAFIDRFDVYSVLSNKPQEVLIVDKTKIEKEESFEKKDSFAKENVIIENKIKNREKVLPISKEKIAVPKKPPVDKRDLKEERELLKEKEKKEKKRREMSIDDFVESCKEYARAIDCSMPGETIPALYERVEEMKEEHIPLTEENAIALIEEAADRAEKPKLFSKPKYDKEGCLLLLEQHFIF